MTRVGGKKLFSGFLLSLCTLGVPGGKVNKSLCTLDVPGSKVNKVPKQKFVHARCASSKVEIRPNPFDIPYDSYEPGLSVAICLLPLATSTSVIKHPMQWIQFPRMM